MGLDTTVWVLFLASFIAVPASKLFHRHVGWFLCTIPLAVFLWLLLANPARVNSEGLLLSLPELGAQMTYRLVGVGHLMSLLLTGIGALIILYAGGYLSHHPMQGRILCYLLIFMASMLGLVLSDNLIGLFIFWELTSISSYLLIGIEHGEEKARKNALQAMLVTGSGGLALLAGLILLGNAAGSYTLSQVTQLQDFSSHPHYVAATLLILFGCFTKSAQFPFHFWLPNAMVAPTPISAYLHSATMVKAGIFLMLVLNPVLGGTSLWTSLLMATGALTFLMGAALGIKETDLKRILAYTTLAVLGLLTMLIGIGTELALKSAILFLLGHALYKAALFMVAGGVDHATGTRELSQLGGLYRLMPLTALGAGLAALSKSGFPPFFGFLGKEYTYKAGLEAGWLGTAGIIVAIAGNMLLLALAFKAGIQPFIGKARKYDHFHRNDTSLWLPPLLLGVAGLALGLTPGRSVEPLTLAAASQAAGVLIESQVKLWQGINTALLLSLITISGGVIIFILRKQIGKLAESFFSLLPPVQRVYDKGMSNMVTLATYQTRFWQSGQLRSYLLIVSSTASILVLYQIIAFGWTEPMAATLPADLFLIGLLLLMTIALVYVLVSSSRMGSLIALGVIGYGIAIIFAAYGAPDLALTQVLVETLTVVLFAFAVFGLPRFSFYTDFRRRLLDSGVAILCGVTLTILMMKGFVVQLAEPISSQMGQWSYLEAKGKNVVNVILVDFRALDTLGEIAVLAISALGIGLLVNTMRGEAR